MSQIDYWKRLADLPPDVSVLDPRDVRGHKNRYLALNRDLAITEALAGVAGVAPVLDLGCGTGSLSRAIAAAGFAVVGADISHALLARTRERTFAPPAAFVQFDGQRLPLRDAAVGAATSYVVLNHVIDDAHLAALLLELHRTIAPGGAFVCVEQVQRSGRMDPSGHHRRRSLDDFAALFAAAGFRPRRTDVVRYGHFPLTMALPVLPLPHGALAAAARLERRLGAVWGEPRVDYADVRFVLDR